MMAHLKHHRLVPIVGHLHQEVAPREAEPRGPERLQLGHVSDHGRVLRLRAVPQVPAANMLSRLSTIYIYMHVCIYTSTYICIYCSYIHQRVSIRAHLAGISPSNAMLHIMGRVVRLELKSGLRLPCTSDRYDDRTAISFPVDRHCAMISESQWVAN